MGPTEVGFGVGVAVSIYAWLQVSGLKALTK